MQVSFNSDMNKSILLLFFFGLGLNAQEDKFQTADSLKAVGLYSEAIQMLQNIEPKSDKIYLKLAKLQQYEGNRGKALKNYEKVLEKNPDRILTKLDHAELLLEAGKLDLADSIFTALIQKYPDNAGFVYRLGLTKEKKKDSTAMKYFFKTISLDFTHQGGLYKTAKHQLKNGKIHNAISLSSSGLEVRPENVSLLSILGQAYSASMQFEKAIASYEKLIELGESSEFILEKLAKAYHMTNQDDKALGAYKKMIEINDGNSAVHSSIGAIYLRKNEVKKAQQHFTMALLIKKQPVDSEYLNIGLTFKRQEDYKSAYTNFKKALAENPENERAHIELALAADAYFVDKASVLKLYENYAGRYKDSGRKDMLSVAEYRISELKKEIHLSE